MVLIIWPGEQRLYKKQIPIPVCQKPLKISHLPVLLHLYFLECLSVFSTWRKKWNRWQAISFPFYLLTPYVILYTVFSLNMLAFSLLTLGYIKTIKSLSTNLLYSDDVCDINWNLPLFLFLAFLPWPLLQKRAQTIANREFHKKNIKEKAAHLASMFGYMEFPKVNIRFCTWRSAELEDVWEFMGGWGKFQ